MIREASRMFKPNFTVLGILAFYDGISVVKCEISYTNHFMVRIRYNVRRIWIQQGAGKSPVPFSV